MVKITLIEDFLFKDVDLMRGVRKASWILATSYLTELEYNITMSILEEKNNCSIPAIYREKADSCVWEIYGCLPKR